MRLALFITALICALPGTALAAPVATSTDLALPAPTIDVSDARLVDFTLGDHEVSVRYRQPASVLGVIPTEVTVTASIAGDGRTRLSYPWYGVFLSTNSTKIKIMLGVRAAAPLFAQVASASVPKNAALAPEAAVALAARMQEVLREASGAAPQLTATSSLASTL